MGRPTKFVSACRAIEVAIETATRTGTGNHKTRDAMTRELAYWATTSFSGDSFARLSNLKLPWNRWDKELYWPGIRVAAALRLMAIERLSYAKARSYTGAVDSDIKEAARLLKQVGASLHDVVHKQHPDVEAILTGSREQLHVNIEARAIEDILLAAAEGYLVAPGRGFKFTEVFGLCFGSVRRKPGRNVAKDVFVNVSRVATQMRAKGTANSVMPNYKSLRAQLHVGNQFFPHLEVVGDYHTHPYRTLVELKANAGWEYSTDDERSLPSYIDDIRSLDHAHPLFSLVVAVATGGKASRIPQRKAPNVVQLSVGDIFFVIGAYRILLDGRYDQRIQISVSASMR